MPNRNRRRDKSHVDHEIPLEDCNGFLLHHVTIREARQGVADGTMRPSWARYRMGTLREDRELLKVTLTSNRVPRYDVRPPITRGEADAAVGLHGPSRTMHLSEEQKRLRVQDIRDRMNRIVPEEDHIERAMVKIAFYPTVTDHLNPATVGPKADLAALEQFL